MRIDPGPRIDRGVRQLRDKRGGESARAHGKNIQNQPVDLPLAGVRGVEPIATLWVVPNGLRVLGEGGASDRFVVSDRAVWVERIEAAVRALRS